MRPRVALAPILLATAAAPALVAAAGPPGLRLAALLLLLGAAPGMALLGPGAGLTAERAGLLVGLSIAVSLLVAQGMVSAGAFSPRVATYALAGSCLPLLLRRLQTGGRLR